MQTRRSTAVRDIFQGLSPVLIIVGAASLIILGILIILFPALLRWAVGIALILGGVGVFASVVTPQQ